MSSSLINIVGILIIYQSLVFIFSILFNKKAKPFFTKILVTICLTIIVHFGYMLMEIKGLVMQLTLGPMFGLIYGPLFYAYTKSLILESVNPKRILIHFFPSLLMAGIILILGSKLIAFASLIGLFVTIHFIAYLLTALKHIFSFRKQLQNTTSSFYMISLSWMELIIYLQLVILIVALLESYFQTVTNTNIIILVIYIFTLVQIHCIYFLGLKQVQLFKGFKEEEIDTNNPTEYSIPEDVFNSYLEKLSRYIEKEKPYLEPDISLQELSDKLSISPRNLSHIINKQFKRNYFSYINHYRLEFAKQSLIETDSPIKKIMYDAGFTSKATFFSCFKSSTGLTPVQYRKNQKSLSKNL